MMKKLLSIALAPLLFSCEDHDLHHKSPVFESGYVEINGTKQFVMIRGADECNTVLLHLHGGPGASAIGGMRKYNADLEGNFTVVYWDRRNAGKSFREDFPASEIKVSKYLEDVDFMAKYLKNKFRVDNVLLSGHSWGSRLGILAVQKFPQHFCAFVSTGQEVAAAEGELQSYRYTLAKAKGFKIDSLVQQLAFIGEPKGGDFKTMYPFPEAFSLQKYILLGLNEKIYDGFMIENIFANFMESDEYTDLEKANHYRAAEFTNEHIVAVVFHFSPAV